jgi:hypothetical protein
MSMQAPRASVLAVALMLAAGCAAGRRGGAGVPDAAGTWEGISRVVLPGGGGPGDTRIERHAWQLAQDGRAVSGYYVVELTMISGDGRPFLCSRTPKFSTLLRFEVRGVVDKGELVLHETGAPRARGTCKPGLHNPERFSGRIAGNVLTVRGAGRQQTLYRRPPDERLSASLAQMSFDEPAAEPGVFPALTQVGVLAGGERRTARLEVTPAKINGYWVWENETRLPNGDLKIEREEWHLQQEGEAVGGFYDRAIEQRSTDGQVYRCNGALDFRVVTRYQVAGLVQGERFVVQEKEFEVLEGGPCDDGRRRLDVYEGEARPGELHLLWGVGRQVLRRSEPELPTQRF